MQYPDALQTMMSDLSSIRTWAGFLQRTEIKFDMLSAVGELAKQAGALHHSSCVQCAAGALPDQEPATVLIAAHACDLCGPGQVGV